MEQMSVEILLTIWGILGSAILFLFKIIYDHGNRINLAENNVENTSKDLKESMERIESDMKEGFDKIERKIDTFFGDENKLLKTYLEKVLGK